MIETGFIPAVETGEEPVLNPRVWGRGGIGLVGRSFPASSWFIHSENREKDSGLKFNSEEDKRKLEKGFIFETIQKLTITYKTTLSGQ